MKGSAQRFTAFFMAVGLCSSTSLAAPPPVVTPPPPVTPGQVQSTLPTQTPQPKPAQAAPLGSAAANPQGVPPGGPSVTVRGFEIEGNTAISTGELQAQIASYVGKSMTLLELYDVTDVLTRYYRAKGYGLASVSLPAQTLSGGTVHLQVIEGRIGKVNIQGNTRTRDTVLQKRVAGLKSGDLYTDAAAERAVLLLNDLPGMGARAVLSPGADFGTSDILFNVDENQYAGDASIDNYGRSVIGRWRVSADFYDNSLTDYGDQLSAGITHSDGNRLNFGKLAYALPVGPVGGTLTSSYNRAEYHGVFTAVGQTGPGLPFSGSTQNAGVSWQYPQTRSTEQSFYWNAGVSWDNSRSLAGSGSAATNSLTTNILLLQVGMFYAHTYGDQSVLTVAGNLWTNGKQYSHSTSLNNVSTERARGELDSAWQHPFAGNWAWVNQLNLSYSVNPLTDADKFNLGGPGSVLGYQSAEQRGDSGYFASSEVQRYFSWGPQPLAWGVFLDTGKVWDKAGSTISNGGSQGSDTSRSISSGGLDLQLLPSTYKLNARLQWAWSIGRKPTDGDGGGHIWFTMGTSF